MLPERHQWKPAVQAAAVILRTPPSTARRRPASHAHCPYTAHSFENALVTRQSPASSARRPRPDGRSHYVVILRDGRKLVLGFALCCHSNATRAPIANPPNSAQLGGRLYHAPKLHPGPCNTVGMRPRTDTHTHTHTHRQTDTQTHRHTDARDHNTFCVVYDSRKMW